MADESRINEAAPGVVETTDRGLFDFMKKKEDVAKPSDHDTMVSGVDKVHISEPDSYRKEEEKKEEKHESLLEKLKHSDSSSSSDEEDDEEKKRKKRERKEKKKGGLKEKFDEKFGHKEVGHHDEHHQYGDTNVPIEKVHHVQENVYSEPSYVAHPPPQYHHDHHVEPTTYVEHPQHFESSHVAPPQHIVNDHVHQEAERKKQEGGFMDKIKDKLPGHKDEAETKTEAATAAPVSAHHAESHVEGEKDKKGFLDKIKEKIPGFHSKTDAEEKKDHHDEEKKEGGHY